MLSFKKDINPLLNLTIPLILTGILQQLVYFLQTVFFGHLSVDALAAGGLVSWMYASFWDVEFH
jgi:MATE family multidrug resistance protein